MEAEIISKKSLFWDVQTVDVAKNADFIIGRILEFGDIEDFQWAVNTYGTDKIKQRLGTAPAMSEKSRSFWCKYFGLDASVCSRK